MSLSRIVFECSNARGVALAVVLSAGVTACSTVKDVIREVLPTGTAYEDSESLPPLEVPPGLASSTIRETYEIPSPSASAATQGRSTTFSEYSGKAAGAQQVASAPNVLPTVPEIWVERSGDKRWLVIQAEPGQVWPLLHSFWIDNGYVIEFEDPSIGIMETAWAEKRPQVRRTGLARLFSGFGGGANGVAVRDKFRVRLERGTEPGTTELFVSHRGARERKEDGKLIWVPRPSDADLEAEILNRLMVSFGYDSDRADRLVAGSRPQPIRARMVKDAEGALVLALREDFSVAWRRTGLALDRVGFTVEDRDRSRGLFFVRYVDPLADRNAGKSKSWLKKLKFWGKDKVPTDSEFLISVVGDEGATRVVVLNKEGERDLSGTGDRILALLHDQLK